MSAAYKALAVGMDQKMMYVQRVGEIRGRRDMSEVTNKVGDWVRYYSNGRLVIGQVEYVSEAGHYGPEVMTDIGSVNSKYIVESRSPQAKVEHG